MKNTTKQSEVIKNTKVTTIAELRKELKLIDLSKVGIFRSYHVGDDSEEEMSKTDQNIHRNYFNIKFNNKLNKEVLSLGVKDCSGNWKRKGYFAEEIDPYTDLVTNWSGHSLGYYDIGRYLKVYEISGGTLEGKINPIFKFDEWSKDYFKPSFTRTLIITDKDGKIIGVHYDHDIRLEKIIGFNEETKKKVVSENTYVRNWLRSKIDSSIRNNWDNLFSNKTFYIPVSTTTHEIKEVSAKTYDDALEKLKNEYPQFKLIEEIYNEIWNATGRFVEPEISKYLSSFSGKVSLPNISIRDRTNAIKGFLSPDTHKNKTKSLEDVIKLAKEELKKIKLAQEEHKKRYQKVSV